MARLIEWSDNATENVDKILEYISSSSKHYAKLFLDGLISSVENLAIFPEMGRKLSIAKDSKVREVFHGSYRIVYKINRSSIEIVCVAHSSRLLSNAYPSFN